MDLNVKCTTINHLEKETWRILRVQGQAEFLDRHTRQDPYMENNGKLSFVKIKHFFCERPYEGDKETTQNREKIFASLYQTKNF